MTADTQKPVHAVVYSAKSTEDKRRSIPEQITDAIDMIEGDDAVLLRRQDPTYDTRPWVLVEGAVYSDEAFSAFSGNRGPGLDRAITRAVQEAEVTGEPVMLIAQAHDRFARGAGDKPEAPRALIELWHQLRRKNVWLRSVEDDGDLRDSPSVANIGHRAYTDSRRKSKSVSKGLRRRAERGQSRGGPRPYGYQREYELVGGERRSHYVIDEAEARIICRIYQEFLAGRSQREIAYGLQKDNVPSIGGKGWPQAAISRISARKLYVGIVEDKNGNEYTGEHQPIIDRETFDRVQTLKRHQSRQVGGRKSHGRHLLTKGMLKCGKCGGTMYPRKAKARPGEYYYCATRMNYGVEMCDQSALPREAVDSALMTYLTKRLLDVEETRRQMAEREGMAVVNARQHQLDTQAQLARAEEQLGRIRRDYRAGKLDAEDYAEFKADLTAEIGAARSEAEQAAKALSQMEGRATTVDLEAELLRSLAAYQDFAASVELAKQIDLDALRTQLRQAFDHVRFIAPDHPLYPTERVQTGGELVAGGVLVPFLAEDSILGWNGDNPILRKIAVPVTVPATVDTGLETIRIN